MSKICKIYFKEFTGNLPVAINANGAYKIEILSQSSSGEFQLDINGEVIGRNVYNESFIIDSGDINTNLSFEGILTPFDPVTLDPSLSVIYYKLEEA